MNLKSICIMFLSLYILSDSFGQESKDKMNMYLYQNSVFIEEDNLPSYPGGINAYFDYINKNLKYPDWEKENQIQGRITTNFIVEKDGTISNIKILRSVPNSKNLEAEAIRLIKNMPKWIPGKKDNLVERMSYSLQIIFSYEKADADKLLKEGSTSK